MRERAKNPVDEAVGARIRLLRKGRKISQEEFGKAIVVTFQQVQKYEIGENRIGAATCAHLCRIF
jgi:transcriptional regulator with XRE-family HTH domain